MLSKTVNKLKRNIDGTVTVSDEELLALVKKAYRKTALIASRGVWGHNKYYASACGALWKAYGNLFLDELGFDKEWQDGFAQGFQYTGRGFFDDKHIPEPQGGPDFRQGFERGKWVADQVFHHWPDSPTVDSVPEV